MDKVWKKGLWIFGMAISFLCYSSIDVSARNEVTMLVCGDTKMESREAFYTLFRDLMGEEGVTVAMGGHGINPDTTYGIRSSVDMDNMSADLSANLNMYYVDDVRTPPTLLFQSDLLVLVYAGKEADGLGNLPLLKKKLKSCKHRIAIPKIAMLRLDEVLASSCNEEQGVRGCALKLIKACGKLWPRCPIEEEDSEPNASGDIDSSDDLRMKKCRCCCF
ncbi:MAG: hypothetical protein LBK92_02970 [Endomicrobium sp.]|nr:hypothetical protein [Endomicrobium sp.]